MLPLEGNKHNFTYPDKSADYEDISVGFHDQDKYTKKYNSI